MKIVIPGGSGQVGNLLSRAFDQDGHDIVVLSRSPGTAPWRVVGWDPKKMGNWADEIDGADVVINLAGRSVNCRYNAENRRAILESRVASTRIVGEAIARATRPPKVWLQAGTATIYAHRFDASNDEYTGIIGGSEAGAPANWRFSVEVASSWERTLDESRVPHTRKLMLRSAMVMSPERGGVFDVLLGLVRLGLGGRAGNGRQFVSWIQDTDFIRAMTWLIDHENIEGPINLASPQPMPNTTFMRDLREASGTRFGLPAAKWMLEVGTFFMRTETELILKSRRVIPGRLTESGFGFKFPSWPEAASDLCGRWRSVRWGEVSKHSRPRDHC